MAVSDAELKGAGPWPLGINNVAPEGRMPKDENGRPVALREADNVDLSSAGFVSRREGYVGCYSGSLVHSLWGHPELDFGLFVDAGTLHVLEGDETTGPLGAQPGDLPVSYAAVGDRVYFSNAQASGMLTVLDRAVHPWGAPATPAAPGAELVDGYGLQPGLYQLAVTVTDALGRESGADRATQIQVGDQQGILLRGLPSAGQVNIYLSAPNDQVMRLAARLPAGTPSYLISGEAEGVKLATHLLDPMPPGQFTRIFNGRHWVADGRTLRWSPPLRYGMTDLAHSLIRFDARIDLLEPVTGEGAGLFLAAGKRTYFLAGADPSALQPIDVHNAGAVPGTSVQVPGQSIGMDDDGDYTVWLSRKGTYVIGLPGGRVAALNAGRTAIDNADRGASLFAARDGRQQVITTLRAPRAQGLAITDRAVAHVIHVDR
ncbi:hypothetical protein [Stenotrophomonas acidaminiphila]|uniref:hypothetical protein n=1 Tax=Stenotrophomonas acidaminiphila TaxID=128780 RepID=UPI001FAED13D|nr:hypothetical protein [Stenotrophomonas acidaminiphila]